MLPPGGSRKATIAPADAARLRRRGPPASRPRARPDAGSSASSCACSTTDHGLPYVFYRSTRGRTSPSARSRSSAAPNPGYFQNPSAYTYLLHLTYPRVIALPFGGGEEGHQAATNASAAWIWDLCAGWPRCSCLVGVAALCCVGRQPAAPADRPRRRRRALRSPSRRSPSRAWPVTESARSLPSRSSCSARSGSQEGASWRWCRARGSPRGSRSASVHGGVRAARAGAGDRARVRGGARPARGGGRARRPGRRDAAGLLRHQPVLLPRLRHRPAPAARAGRAPPATRTKFGQQGDSGPRCTTSTASAGASATWPGPSRRLAGAVLARASASLRSSPAGGCAPSLGPRPARDPADLPGSRCSSTRASSRASSAAGCSLHPALALLAGLRLHAGLRLGPCAVAALALVDPRRWRAPPCCCAAAAAADARSMAVLGNTDTRAIARQWAGRALAAAACGR